MWSEVGENGMQMQNTCLRGLRDVFGSKKGLSDVSWDGRLGTSPQGST